MPGPRQPASGGRGGHARRLVALEAASQIRRSPGWLERRWNRASWRLSRPTCRRRAAREGEDASASERPEPEREAVRLPPKACLDPVQKDSAMEPWIQDALLAAEIKGWGIGGATRGVVAEFDPASGHGVTRFRTHAAIRRKEDQPGGMDRQRRRYYVLQ